MRDRLPLVLCAEDEESDRIILRRAFSKAGIKNPLVVVPDGQEVIDYLSGTGQYHDRKAHPLPALLILDLKMPRRSGFDVLAWMSGRPELAGIPVVIYSSSMSEADMRATRQLGVKEYFVKPNDLAEYSKVVRNLYGRWIAK